MGVELTPGTHQVAFRYRNPWWQKLGALACGLAIAVLLVLPGVGVGWLLQRVV